MSPSAEAGASPGAAGPAHPHASAVAEVVHYLDVDPGVGLSSLAADRRRRAAGRNVLAAAPPPTWLVRFVRQFRSLLIGVLLAAAALSLVVGAVKDTVVILVVLLLNAVLGTVQEARADHSVRALQALLPSRARVRRDGAVAEIPAEDLVPGDVVLVAAGDRVPADGRVVVDAVLAVDESSLTGESAPVSKLAEVVLPADTPVADRRNVVWMNTTVVRGRGELVVTATGMRTRIGEVARLLAEAPARATPLQRQVDVLARRLAALAGVAVLAVFGVALLRGDGPVVAALDAIALAVAAIPEGLPAVVTITLALGTAAMARHRAIVTRLTSVETLGSTQVICTDKTGTLTRNEMAVRTVVFDGVRCAAGGRRPEPCPSTASGLAPAMLRGLEAAVLCNDAEVPCTDGPEPLDAEVVGDPTEVALLVLARRWGIDVAAVRARPRVAEIPFDPATKLMATLHATAAGGWLVAVKGAPDLLLDRCTHVATRDGEVPLGPAHREALAAEVAELAGEGLRTLGIATRHMDTGGAGAGGAEADAAGVREGAGGLSEPGPEVAPEPEPEPGTEPELSAMLDGLTFELLVGIVDPPRAGAGRAVALARQAGIRVLMVTGDHPDTAAAIAREVGIDGEVVTGCQLDVLDDADLGPRLADIGVYARVAPEHKVRLVRLLQAAGCITAMTGDGVNDAAALKSADIGVAMGRSGTEVARQAADLILTDDDITTIVTAVARGRGIYDNILAFVRFQLATNIGAIITILGARLIGLPAPFTPVQVLWVNLIMDGPPALALGADPVRPDVMQRPPRDPDAPILDRGRLGRLVLAGTVMAAGTLGVFAWALATDPDDGGAVAGTLAFTTFVLFQFVNAVNARLEDRTVFDRHTLRNGHLWLALAGVLCLQVLAVQVPVLGGLVDVVPLSGAQWLVAVGTAGTLLASEELRKLLIRYRRVRTGVRGRG